MINSRFRNKHKNVISSLTYKVKNSLSGRAVTRATLKDRINTICYVWTTSKRIKRIIYRDLLKYYNLR